MCADIKAALGGQPKGCPQCGGTGDAEAWAARIKGAAPRPTPARDGERDEKGGGRV